MTVTRGEPALKLEPNGLVDLGGLDGEQLAHRTFVSTYHDTPGRLLGHSGVTLRRRLENGRNDWQLALPTGEAVRMIEIPGPPSGPPAEITALLPAFLRGDRLAPVATLRTARDGVRVDVGDGIASVALDQVAVLDGGRVVETFGELEIELVSGGAQALDRVERRLGRLGAHRSGATAGFDRALQIVSPAIGGSDVERVIAYAARSYHDLLRADAGVRLGADIEPVHALRVSVRRLRALLRAARPLLDHEWANRMREKLAHLGDAFGTLRDLDVLSLYLRHEALSLDGSDRETLAPAFATLAADHAAARATALETLEGESYFALLDALAPPVPIVGSAPLKAVAAKELKRLKKTMRATRADDSDELLHRARIEAKRVRYVAEALGSDRVVRRAKTFQDVIGEHQDAVVAEERLRALAARVPESALPLGMLVERQRIRRDSRRDEVPHAWKQLERAGADAWS